MKKGQSLIELMIVIAMLAILLPAILTGFVASRGGRVQQQQRLQATSVMNETMEAVRSFKESGWQNIAGLTMGNTYHPVTGSAWTLQSGAETLSNGFTRQIIFSNVMRNSSGAIDTAGTILDPSTKKVDITVSWTQPYSSSSQSTFYITRFRDNLTYYESSTAQFAATGSIFNGTATDATIGDGAVTLAKTGAADWCQPGNPIVKHDLQGNGLAGNVVAGVGYAFVGTGKNASSKAFYNVKIDNSTNPPAVNVAGNYNPGGLKANDVFGESHYAYIAPDNNTNEEVFIIDVSSDTPTLVSSINFSGNKGSKTLFVSNNMLYFVASNNNLYVYDISNRSNPISKSPSPLSVGDVKKIYVVNGYVYLVMNTTSGQFKIVNATNPASMYVASTLTINDKLGMDVFVNDLGTRAYFITQLSSLKPEFYIVNVENKSSPSLIGSGYNTDPMDPQGITVIDNRAIIVGFNRPQYHVVKVDGDTYNQCAVVPKTGDPAIDDIYDVSSIHITTHSYSYITTNNTSNAFQIIEGGPGGSGNYMTPGTFESNPFTPASTYATAFNRFTANINQSSPTTLIQMQVAVANQVSGSCPNASSNYTYVGPNGDTGAYFTSTDNSTIQGTIPFGSFNPNYNNPNKCVRYKLFLSTTNVSQSPSFNDITINYSP